LSARLLDAAQVFSSGRSMTKAGIGIRPFDISVNGVSWRKAVPLPGTALANQ
jgi:hypothetical protein